MYNIFVIWYSQDYRVAQVFSIDSYESVQTVEALLSKLIGHSSKIDLLDKVFEGDEAHKVCHCSTAKVITLGKTMWNKYQSVNK